MKLFKFTAFTKKLQEFSYGITTTLTGVFFIVYMFNKFPTSSTGDVVGSFNPLLVIYNLFLHIPFLLSIFVSMIMYFIKKNVIASYILGITSLIYLILHQFVFSYSYYYESFFYFKSTNIRSISLFPLFGVIISISALINYHKRNK